LVLTWQAEGNVGLATASLGQVSPLELVRLDQLLELPPRAVEALLTIVTPGGGASRLALLQVP